VRVLYVTNYQGPAVVAQRGHTRNRILGPSRKVELLASALVVRGHSVDVVSPATVREGTARIYRGFECTEPGCGGARVRYLSGIDLPRANLLCVPFLLRKFYRHAPRYDAVVLYNLEWYFLRATEQYARATEAPLIVEYEDDACSVISARLTAWHRSRGARAIALARKSAAGVMAVSPELQRQLAIANSVVMPGIVGDDILSLPRRQAPLEGALRVVYAGGLNHEKGPDLLVQAIRDIDWAVEVDVVGAGPLLAQLRAVAASCLVPVRVHGEVSRAQLASILGRAHVAVNPHRMSQERLGQIFPFKVVEYLGAGLPVVSSRLGESPPELRGSMASVVMYESNEAGALRAALTEARARLGDLQAAAVAARATVAEEFSPAAAARKLEVLLVSAGANAGRREVA
jgi:glycosyltransferase involved in cell wall biosynthesis